MVQTGRRRWRREEIKFGGKERKKKAEKEVRGVVGEKDGGGTTGESRGSGVKNRQRKEPSAKLLSALSPYLSAALATLGEKKKRGKTSWK